MPSLYQAFGLTLQASRAIPGLPVLKDRTATIDVLIDLPSDRKNKRPNLPEECWYQGPQDFNGHRLKVWRTIDGRYFHFQYSDGIEFFIERSGKRILAFWNDSMTLDDMATYLLGPVMGFVLRLRGFVCLHASAVAIANHAVAFLNPGGHGKSTLAAVFAKQGDAVLTDDIVALVDQGNSFEIQSGFPRIRLWPASVEALFNSAVALPRITPDHTEWDKRYLDLTDNKYKFQATSLPLAAIYTGKRNEALKSPRIETISKRQGLLSLLANTYNAQILGKEMHALQFDVLNRLVKTVSLKYFWIPKGIQYLPALCDAVRNDIFNSQRSNAGTWY